MDEHPGTRYRQGPNCATRAVDGLVRAGLAGLAWGVFSSNYDRRMRKSLGFSYVATNTLKTSVTWGTVAATYLGLHCVLERTRKQRDTLNATIAGGATGAILSLSMPRSRRRFLLTTLLSAGITTLVDQFRPTVY